MAMMAMMAMMIMMMMKFSMKKILFCRFRFVPTSKILSAELRKKLENNLSEDFNKTFSLKSSTSLEENSSATIKFCVLVSLPNFSLVTIQTASIKFSQQNWFLLLIWKFPFKSIIKIEGKYTKITGNFRLFMTWNEVGMNFVIENWCLTN